MLPNNMEFSPFISNTSTPIKSYLLNSNKTLFTPDKYIFDNSSNNINTLILLAAASSSKLSSSLKNSTITSISSSVSKKRKIDKSYSNGVTATGNRLDRAVRKLTDRLEAKFDHSSDNFAAVSPLSSASTSSSLSDNNKGNNQDDNMYISSNSKTNKVSTETMPIKNTDFLSDLTNYNNILMCSNKPSSSIDNIVNNQLTKFFQNNPSLQNLISLTNSAVTQNSLKNCNSLVDSFDYLNFFKNLTETASASALSTSNNNILSTIQNPKIETKVDKNFLM